MVDAIVSYVVQNIGDYLIKEAIFLSEVRNEVLSLKNELEWMQCFIKDADQKRSDNPLIGKWLSDLRDIAHDTEDVLEKYLLEVHNDGSSNVVGNDEEGTSSKSSRFFASIKKQCCCCLIHRESRGLVDKAKKEVKLYSIGKDIEALKKRINALSQKRERYGLQDINNKREEEINAHEKLKQIRKTTSFSNEENVVGFVDDANKLLAQLLNNEPCRFVISILGMGGLGKTTLAGKLYRNKDVKEKFNCSAWVYVSNHYTIADLLLRLIKSFDKEISKEELEKMSGEEDMERYLHKFLQERKYLVAIDDVWHKEAWESLKRAFPDNKKGSRVIITTRIKDVAERSDERTHVHRLRFLKQDESWQLFCEKAFRNIAVDEGLEKLGREMVQKCGGLPLAIVVLGGLLSTKEAKDWRAVRDHIWRHLRNDSIHISNILDLSFSDLPHQLKLCFLYLGLFPEDFEINLEKLVRLLVAEGFIEQYEDQTMEDVAKDYLDQLIDRSLIQVDRRWWGKIATLRVHDLLRDLAIEKAKELNFIHIYDKTRSSTSSSSMPPCPRQAVYTHIADLSLQHINPQLRSVLFFNQSWEGSLSAKKELTHLCEMFPLLRVLDIEVLRATTGVGRWNNIPEDIGSLIHLRYIGLKNLNIREVPDSILYLQRLQTLDLFSDQGFLELPAEIGELQELRHLIGMFTGQLQIHNLTNLQTLKYVTTESWSKIRTDKLVNLQKLHIKCDSGFGTREKFSFLSIAKLRNLQVLSIELTDGRKSFSSLQPLSNCACLIELRLLGKINQLPEDMHAVLPILECLSLEKSELSDDPMPILERLSNLVILKLSLAFDGKKMVCTEKGFPRLEILDVSPNLQEWQVEEGAMPMLKGLNVAPLRGLPERLISIPRPDPWECNNDYWNYQS